MLRNNLLENNYNFERKMPKKWLVSMIWTFLCLSFLAGSFGIFILAIMLDSPERLHLFDYGIFPYIIIFAVISILYFGLKIRMTSSFCNNKEQNMAVRITEDGLPVFACKEALKTWQIILVHTMPAVLIYIILCAGILSIAFDVYLVMLLFVVSFVLAYDLALVVCVLFMRAKYKPDYIAVNRHIYDMTLYTR